MNKEDIIRMAKECGNWSGQTVEMNDVGLERFAKLVRAAIEQAQEPVAWMHNLIEGNAITHRPADIDRHPERWTALYTAPPPCPTCEALARSVMMDQTSHDMAPRQWQGLTDEERGITAAETWGSVLIAPQSYPAFARAIEAKLKEKNT